MRSNGHLDHEQELQLFPLNPSCSGGDHYLNTGKFFYIIRGNEYIFVNDLSEPIGEDGSATMKGVNSIRTINSVCQNGDHYLYAGGNFVVIFKASNEYLVVSDLNTGNVVQPLTKMSSFTSGVYFFGPPKNVSYPLNSIGVIHQVDKVWGAMFTYTTRLDSNGESVRYFIYPDIVNFILGGLTMNFGPVVPVWKPLQTFTNTSNAAVTWSETLTKTVGFNKLHYESLESNWSTTTEVLWEQSFLLDLLSKLQLKLNFLCQQPLVVPTHGLAKKNGSNSIKPRNTLSLSFHQEGASTSGSLL